MVAHIVGYKRVSSEDQSTDRQLVDIKLDKEFIDTVSGNNLNRDGLRSCISYVRSGDILIIDSIDRLARNLRDLQDIINTLVSKGVIVKFVKENMQFNSNSDPMSTLMLQMMGAFAEFERTMIRSRQKDGITAAKKAGKHLGRPKLDKKLSKKAIDLKSKGHSISNIASQLKLSRPSIYKLICCPHEDESFNKETIQALQSTETHKIENIDEFFKNINIS
jgi:DNA invertase Pin-like site-specific DNA recombinase